MKNFNPVRGTYDYMPKAARFREEIRHVILENYLSNGFNLIETPILENIENLNSSDGGDNLRLMFKTIKRGDKLDLTKPNLTEDDIVEEGLRYDLTVPLARFFSNNKEKLPTPFKSIQIGYSFRAERPQKGRNRQFIQCDLDILGDESINAELEILNTALDTYKKLNIPDLTVRINHKKILNSLVLAAGFKEEDFASVCRTLDKIDKISINGVIMELIENGFDTENINRFVEIINAIQGGGLEAVRKYCEDQSAINDLKFLVETLSALNPDCVVKFDVSIVRGQGYYTGAVYEIYTTAFSGALGGGGRYDNMVESFTGTHVPAVGFGLGFEPVCVILAEGSALVGKKENLALIYDESDDMIEVFKIKEKLKEKYNVSLFLRKKNMKNFYEKLLEVADLTLSVKDFNAGVEPKTLK